MAHYFPNSVFVPGASSELYGVSRRSVRSQFSSFSRNRLLWIFVSELQLLPENSLLSTSCWTSPRHQHVESGNDCHKCIAFQTCNHDTGEDVDIHTTIFCISPHRQGSLALVAGLASRHLSFSRQSVLSLSVQKRVLALCPFFHVRGRPQLA